MYAKHIAATSAVRLLSIGHNGSSNILAEFNLRVSEVDLCSTQLNLIRTYEVGFQSRAFYEASERGEFQTKISTDGSKTKIGCGAAFTTPKARLFGNVSDYQITGQSCLSMWNTSPYHDKKLRQLSELEIIEKGGKTSGSQSAKM